jgi:hypothetical protein
MLIPPIKESVVLLRDISGAAGGAWSVQVDVRSWYWGKGGPICPLFASPKVKAESAG